MTTQTFKDVVDAQLKEKLADAKKIEVQMPYFFRMTAYNTESSAAFTPMPEKPTAKEWHDKIRWLQLCLKDTRIDASEGMNAMQEILRFVTGAYKVLLDAYDIQGRVLIKVCEQLGVDFDLLIADLVLAHDEKGLAYVVDKSADFKASTEEADTTTEEDSSGEMPY